MTDRSWDRLGVGAVGAGAAVRALWGLVLHRPFEHVYSDMSEYVSKAEKLALKTPAA